jgi:signal transduction histidine kinase
MRRFLRRPLLWLLPVIVIPLAALAVIQYRFLRTLQQATASAQRNLLRGALEEVSRDVELAYREAADAALAIDPNILCRPAEAADHFRRSPILGAETFFTVAFEGEHAKYCYFDTAGTIKSVSPEEIQAVKLATSPWLVAHKLRRVVTENVISVDERDTRHRTIMKPVIDESMHVVGIAGVLLNEKASRRALMQIGERSIARYEKEADLVLQIGDRVPRAGGDYVTAALPSPFATWRVGIRDICATPEEVAEWEFRHNMYTAGGTTVVLFGAIFLSMQAVARQMRLSQMKGDFVSNVSHELRTPLASIRVFGEYMRLGRVTTEEKVREYGEYIEAESRRLTALINNILDFSKIESAEKKYKFVETDVVALVRDTVDAFAMPLREHGYTFVFRAPEEPVPPLTVDKDAIGQVLVNLLDNAVKYSNGRKEIEVQVTAGCGGLRITVRDHGIGIPPSEQKKIFEKFYRVSSGLVHDVKGSGLGLAIVSHVMKAHGGRVEVESKPGEGSAFTIVMEKVA